MSFTAYTQLCLARAFTHLGFPAYFRVELSWANLLGVVLLLAPVPARLREWAYAAFAINLASALMRERLLLGLHCARIFIRLRRRLGTRKPMLITSPSHFRVRSL